MGNVKGTRVSYLRAVLCLQGFFFMRHGSVSATPLKAQFFEQELPRPMKHPRIVQLIGVLALLIVPTIARADEIALWNFNDSNLVVDRGVGILTTTANPANIMFFSGTAVNARMGDPPGMALAIQGGANNQNNGSILELRASTVGFNSLTLSWAWQRTATGFNSILAQYSINGTTFLDVGPAFTPPASFGALAVVFEEVSGTWNNPNFAFRGSLMALPTRPETSALTTSWLREAQEDQQYQNQRRCFCSEQA
jgi:hypothetical protein